MKAERLLRTELLGILDGGAAHMEFDEVVDDLTIEQVNAKPPKTPYSIWHMVEHIRIAQWDILNFIIDPHHVSPDYPDGYRPAAGQIADEAAWVASIDGVRGNLAAFRRLVKESESLLTSLPHAPGYTVLRELILAADHTAYHVGEIALMRQVMGFWPSNKPYLTG